MSAAPKTIGIDIGGTKTAVAAVDSSGQILQRATLPTEAALGFERAVNRLGDAIEELLANTGWSCQEIAGIGIGCAAASGCRFASRTMLTPRHWASAYAAPGVDSIQSSC